MNQEQEIDFLKEVDFFNKMKLEEIQNFNKKKFEELQKIINNLKTKSQKDKDSSKLLIAELKKELHFKNETIDNLKLKINLNEKEILLLKKKSWFWKR